MLPEIEAVQEALRAGGADCRQALSSLAAKLCKMAQEHTQLMEEAKAPLGALAACVHIIRVHVNKRLLVHKVGGMGPPLLLCQGCQGMSGRPSPPARVRPWPSTHNPRCPCLLAPPQVAQAAAVREQLEEHKDLAYLIWAYDRDPTGAGLVKKL